MILNLLKTHLTHFDTLKTSPLQFPNKSNQSFFEKQLIPGLGQEVYMTILTSCHIRKQGGNERLDSYHIHRSPLEVISISLKIGCNDHNQLPHQNVKDTGIYSETKKKKKIQSPLEVARVPFHYSKNSKEKEFIYPASSVQRITKQLKRASSLRRTTANA